jgi:hypothetical protein
MVGIPGGMKPMLYKMLKEMGRGMVTFKAGHGADLDNFGKASVWIYDSNLFPFYQA